MVLTMFVAVLLGTAIGRTITSDLTRADNGAPTPIGLDRILFGTVLLVIIAWGLGSLRAYRSAATDLQSVQQSLTLATAASEDALRIERDEVVAPIAATLRELLEALPHLAVSGCGLVVDRLKLDGGELAEAALAASAVVGSPRQGSMKKGYRYTNPPIRKSRDIR